jgi:hypothetical protein
MRFQIRGSIPVTKQAYIFCLSLVRVAHSLGREMKVSELFNEQLGGWDLAKITEALRNYHACSECNPGTTYREAPNKCFQSSDCQKKIKNCWHNVWCFPFLFRSLFLLFILFSAAWNQNRVLWGLKFIISWGFKLLVVAGMLHIRIHSIDQVFKTNCLVLQNYVLFKNFMSYWKVMKLHNYH